MILCRLYNFLCTIFNYPHWHKITSQLYIGDNISSVDTIFLKKEAINVIVNCTPDLPFTNYNKKTMYHYRINVHDDLSYSSIYLMSIYMKQIIPILHNHIKKRTELRTSYFYQTYKLC